MKKDALKLIRYLNLLERFGLATISKNQHSVFAKFYPLILFVCYCFCLLFCLYMRFPLYKHVALDATQIVLNVIRIILEISFFCDCWCIQRKEWKKCLQCLEQLEEIITTCKFKYMKNNTIVSIILHVVNTVFLVSGAAIWYTVTSPMVVLSFADVYVGFFLISIVVILIPTFEEVVTNRYHFVKKILESVGCQNIEETQKLQLLAQVRNILKLLYKMIDSMNNILGWKILLILQIYIIDVLDNLLSVVDNRNGSLGLYTFGCMVIILEMVRIFYRFYFF